MIFSPTTREKGGELVGSESVPPSPDNAISSSSQGHDLAYDFLARAKETVHGQDTAQVNLVSVRHKVDWRFMPLMFLCYAFSFLDKVLINYSAVMGLTKELHLKGNQFANLGTFLFVALVIAEIPNGFILNKVPVAKWLGINVALWGIATASSAAANDYKSLLTARIFIGIFEAAIAPCLIIISSQWYTKKEQGPRFAIWYCGLGAGEVVGGLLSYGFQHYHSAHGATLYSWKLMFLVLGCVTILLGITVCLVLPDSPMTAKFLSDTEKAALLQHVSINQTGVVGRKFKASQVVELLLDFQIWAMIVMTTLLSTAAGVGTTWSSTLLTNQGYKPEKAALLNCPSGAISIVASLIGGYGVRTTSSRWLWVVILAYTGLIGGALMAFLPKTNPSGLLAGIWLINFNAAIIPVIYGWIAANVAGYTKRAFAVSLIGAAFNLGNIIGPQTFRAKDAPLYQPARIAIVAVLASGGFCAVVLFGYYALVNKRRDQRLGQADDVDAIRDDEKWVNLTDKENSSFRYVY